MIVSQSPMPGSDTLFRLFAYGSQTLQSKGYSRKAQENVVAPMPAMGEVVATDDDLWRILTFIRAVSWTSRV